MRGATKPELRKRISALRRALSADELADARGSIRAAVLRRRDASGWACVAAYIPLRTEPGSTELLTGLVARGVRVLVPVLLPDNDLDWTPWPATGPALGVDAIGEADAVLVPALAVARDGTRLGRGGGSYDRALGRARPGVPMAALLFDGELLDELPREPWDVAVTAAVLPGSWQDVGGSARGGAYDSVRGSVDGGAV